ncbi:MAG: putative metallopeptidase [Thermoprotei archaeon]
MGRRLRFEFAEDVRKMAELINERLNLGLDLDKIAFIRTRGSKSRAIARTFALPSQWRFVMEPKYLYVIEVISEKFDRMSCEDKLETVLHELMHVPRSMSGGLRGHNYAGFRAIRRYRPALLTLCGGADEPRDS